MKKMRKILSMLLAVCMIFTGLEIDTSAQEQQKTEGFTSVQNIQDTTGLICLMSLILTQRLVTHAKSLNPVGEGLRIEADHYRVVDGVLTSVWDLEVDTFEIPEGVTEIAPFCFWNCSIRKIVFPESLKIIRGCAFYDSMLSNSLKEVVNKSTQIEDVEDWAFAGLPSLADENGLFIFDKYLCVTDPTRLSETVTIPEGVEVICKSAFELTEIKSIIFPSTLKSIREDAFNGSSLTGALIFPDGLEYIGADAFKFTNIASVTIPKNTIVSNGTFSRCNRLMENAEDFVIINHYLYGASKKTTNIAGKVVVPEDVVFLSDCSMNDLQAEEVVLPSTLTGLGDSVFNGCYKLRKINMPETVVAVGGDSFRDCELLADEYGVVNLGNICFGTIDAKNDEEIARKIPKGIEIIAPYSFYNCKSPVIELPSTLRIIGAKAFEYCQNLTEVSIPEGVERIEANAFSDTGIRNLVLPSTVKYIGTAIILSRPSESETILTILSMDAEIDASWFPIDKIVGPKGSTAEAFCAKYGVPFEVYFTPSDMLGDVDNDNSLTANDALGILKCVVGVAQDCFNETMADCDGESGITANDALHVLKKVVGLIP